MRSEPTLFVQAGEFHFNPDHIVAFRQYYQQGDPTHVEVWTTNTGGVDGDAMFSIRGTVEEFRDLLYKAGCDLYFTDGGSVSR